jgi:hypothetical protein
MTGVAAMCADHPDREAKSGVCARCGNFLCAECARTGTGGAVFCPRCAVKVGLGGKLHHLPWLGGFLIAQGILTILASLFFTFYTAFFTLLDDEALYAEGAPPGPGLELFAGIYGFLALLHVVPGVLQIVAARNVFKRRNRVFVFVALGSSMLTLMPGCCAPTAIALLIYGLIVLLDHSVAGAFDRPSDGEWGPAEPGSTGREGGSPSERTEVS